MSPQPTSEFCPSCESQSVAHDQLPISNTYLSQLVSLGFPQQCWLQGGTTWGRWKLVDKSSRFPWPGGCSSEVCCHFSESPRGSEPQLCPAVSSEQCTLFLAFLLTHFSTPCLWFLGSPLNKPPAPKFLPQGLILGDLKEI